MFLLLLLKSQWALGVSGHITDDSLQGPQGPLFGDKWDVVVTWPPLLLSMLRPLRLFNFSLAPVYLPFFWKTLVKLSKSRNFRQHLVVKHQWALGLLKVLVLMAGWLLAVSFKPLHLYLQGDDLLAMPTRTVFSVDNFYILINLFGVCTMWPLDRSVGSPRPARGQALSAEAGEVSSGRW